MKKVFVIFVGPQGVGKTTQAEELMLKLKAQGYKVHTTRLISYVILQYKFQSFLKNLFNRKVLKKFYEDEGPQENVDPELYRKVFLVMEGLYLLGFIIATLKKKVLMMYNNILIEHEGYVFKQLADLWFLAKELGITGEKSFAQRVLSKLTKFLLLSILKERSFMVVLFQADYSSIRTRYLTRSSHIEPEKYVEFQSFLYDRITFIISEAIRNDIKLAKINADGGIDEIHSGILSRVLQYIKKNSR